MIFILYKRNNLEYAHFEIHLRQILFSSTVTEIIVVRIGMQNIQNPAFVGLALTRTIYKMRLVAGATNDLYCHKITNAIVH